MVHTMAKFNDIPVAMQHHKVTSLHVLQCWGLRVSGMAVLRIDPFYMSNTTGLSISAGIV